MTGRSVDMAPGTAGWTRRAGPRPLLEREGQLAALDDALTAAAAGQGSLVLVAGEAGIGKTALLRRFAESAGRARVLVGACDPLETPRALGPLLDIAPGLGAGFQRRLAESAGAAHPPADLFAALAAELTSAGPPLVLVFEDVHWGDQATLDLLRFVGRRVDRLPAVVAATYREEEAQPGSPAAVLLGDLATAPGVRRLAVTPLSLEATAQLAGRPPAEVADLHRRTGGNPFYITEALAAGGTGVPATVRDAVMARVARLSVAGRQGLEAAAAIGARVDPDQLAAVLDATGTPRWATREVSLAGLLVWQDDRLAFRHEIAQAAIASATAPDRRQRLHEAILAAMRRDPEAGLDHAALVRHAEAAGDDAAVAELAPPAAGRAASLGAHREAAALYELALARGRLLPAAERAELVERHAHECYEAGRLADAADGHARAAADWAALGDHEREGRNLVRVTALSFLAGRYGDVEPAFQGALAVLEALPPSPILAMAYESRARLLFMAQDAAGSGAWARRAADLAAGLGDEDTVLNATVTAGAARLFEGHLDARSALEDARRRAVERGMEDLAARATLYLGWLPCLHRAYEGVDEHLAAGLAHAEDRGLGYWRALLTGALVQANLDRGRWQDVREPALAQLAEPDPNALAMLQALVGLGRLAARRGQPDAWEHLDRAAQEARRHPPAAVIVPVWAARAEAAWLEGDGDRVREEVRTGLAHPGAAGSQWGIGELALWSRQVGEPAEVLAEPAEPYRLALAGDLAGAAAWWRDRGCPYDAAIALLLRGDLASVEDALAALDRLGARPAAAMARRRLRELGVAAVPRGPRPSTAANAAGLTRREQEVLALVAAGLTNAQVAGRLFLSEKTVERHLSGILRKLDADTRGEAVAAARRLGALDAGRR